MWCYNFCRFTYTFFFLQALQDLSGDQQYLFDPAGFVTDEHGGNRESIKRSLRDGAVERAYSCEFHVLQCAERQINKAWSDSAQKRFRKLVKKILYASTPTAFAVAKQEFFSWADEKPSKRKHAKSWFRSFWEPRKSHIFRAFKQADTPHVNFAEVGHSKNARRGARNQPLSKVAEDHIVESAILKSKLQNFMNGTYHGGNVPTQRQRNKASYASQVRRANQFGEELVLGSLDFGPHDKTSTWTHRQVTKQRLTQHHQALMTTILAFFLLYYRRSANEV